MRALPASLAPHLFQRRFRRYGLSEGHHHHIRQQKRLAVRLKASIPDDLPARYRGVGTLELDVDQAWQRLSLVQRQLKVAVADEDYLLAAKLRDEQKTLLESLPPLLQYAMGQVARLRSGTLQEQLQTINNLAEAGEPAVIPDLASCLAVPELQEATEKAMWALFMKARDPRINELMEEGCSYMRHRATYDKALAVFDKVIQLQPSFVEGYNKRATVLHLMGKHQQSIDDCKLVLQMQPYHFGAASGLGLCLLRESRLEEALAAFEAALLIHPGMTSIKRLASNLKQQLRAREDEGEEGEEY